MSTYPDDHPNLTADARTLLDLLTAAFTGDVNEALDLARACGSHPVLSWSDRRVDDARDCLVTYRCLKPGAPKLNAGWRAKLSAPDGVP